MVLRRNNWYIEVGYEEENGRRWLLVVGPHHGLSAARNTSNVDPQEKRGGLSAERIVVVDC
jgi:hypothetical protein